jgi:hypothetical protein
MLTHTFGAHGAWEVRTTLLADGQILRYRCCVLRDGKVRKWRLGPIEVDWTPQLRRSGAMSQELLAIFANEAVLVHLARCAEVAGYARRSIPASSRRGRRGTTAIIAALLSGALLSAGVWWWMGRPGVGPEPPSRRHPPASVRWQPAQVVYQVPAGESFAFALPGLERTPAAIPVAVALEASSEAPSWLTLDPERLHISGTAPATAAGQTYRLGVRARTERGADSLLRLEITVTGPPDRRPARLRAHWAW